MSPHYLCVTRMMMFLKANFNSARKRVRNIVLVCVAISINSIARTSLRTTTTTARPDPCKSSETLCMNYNVSWPHDRTMSIGSY